MHCTRWPTLTYHSLAGPEEPDSNTRRSATNDYARVTFSTPFLHSLSLEDPVGRTE